MSFPPVPRSVVLPVLLAVLGIAPARADDAAEIARLAQSGKGEEALRRIDTVLARQPRDAQMRFMKGVMLSETRPAEAIGIFTRLTQDYPDLPEPYNNLAVLYASLGQYEKARSALDRAIRTSPAYATAYENLGDIHARLASQAYDKALQIESGKAGAGTRLALVRSLAVPAGHADAPAAAPIAEAAVKPAVPAPPTSVVLASTTSAGAPGTAVPTSRAESGREQKTAFKVAVMQERNLTPEPATPEPAKQPRAIVEPAAVRMVKVDKSEPVAGLAHEAALGADAVMGAVNDWARAWSAQDVQAYLAHYAPDFSPPKGGTRKAWMEERQVRIAGKGRISVRIEAPQVSISGSSATARFRQIYVSDRLSASSRKTLQLERLRGKWLITQERTGS
jgi:Flp pilus assembly protein TadD/ketosteroid isomerase-like protein